MPENKIKTVITYGSFDLFHIGHLKILERAAALGQRLVVGVSTDEFNALKGKRSIFSYQHRAQIVGALKCVDEVFPEFEWEQKNADIERYKADVFVMGDDWAGKFDEDLFNCEVIYLPRTNGISTSDLKNDLKAWDSECIAELKRGLEVIQGVLNQIVS